MKSFKYQSNSDKDTLKLGKTLASFLQNKDTIILSGELGAGKTKFTEGILTYFDLQDEQTRPLTLEEYNQLVDKYFPEDELIDLNMQKFTIENIEDLA